MWEALKQIILLGTDQQNFSKSQLALLEDFGIDTTKPKAQIALEALSLWEKMKSVGLETEEHSSLSSIKFPFYEKTINKELSGKLALIFKYNDFYRMLPSVFSSLSGNAFGFPPELIPHVLEHCRKDLDFLEACESYFDERFYWLADQNKTWNFISAKASAENFDRNQVSIEKLYLFKRWIDRTPQEALTHINELEKVDPNLTLSLLKTLFRHREHKLTIQFAEKIKSQKRKSNFGLAAQLLASDPSNDFTKELSRLLKDVLQVTENEINIVEVDIAKLRSLLPKGMLPFKNLESFNNEFDKNLFFYALSICPPELLFDNAFKMPLDDFINTVTHLGFYDDLILQALIHSASFHDHKSLLNALIKIFRSGTYEQLIWSPILSKLNPSQLNKEFNFLLKQNDFDESCLQIVMEKHFNWPPNATQAFIEYLLDLIQHAYFNAKNPLMDVFKDLCLKCHPDFYRSVNEAFLSNNILSFQLHKVFKKYINMLRLRQQIQEGLKV